MIRALLKVLGNSVNFSHIKLLTLFDQVTVKRAIQNFTADLEIQVFAGGTRL